MGMHGSGVFLVNPPWTLAAELKEALPWLADTLKLGAPQGLPSVADGMKCPEAGTASWSMETSAS
jgi:hypothetical protein